MIKGVQTCLISHKSKFVYYYIPKVACSFLKTRLGSHFLDGFDTASPDPHKQLRALEKPWTVARDLNGYFHFALIRNPWKRIESYYKNKVETQKVVKTSVSFDKFCQDIRLYWKKDTHHLSPQFQYLPQDLSRLDLLGKLKDIDKFCAVLNERLGTSISHESSHNRNKTSSRPLEVSEHSRQVIEEFYQEDYELYAKTKDLY